MWVLVIVALTGVWKASSELGLATWWIGRFGGEQLTVVVPFVLPAMMIIVALNNTRALPWLGLAASAGTIAIGAADLGRVARLGLVEIALGAAAAAFSVATTSGRYRAA